jgi:cyclophilin family peptidyl-prolyl cis-trans isomerase
MKSPMIVGCLVVALSGLLGTAASAQEALDASPSSQTAPQAKAEFERLFAEYKTALLGMEQLRTQYQTANRTTQDELNAEFKKQAAETQKLLDNAVVAAEEAYRLAPNTDPQITNLLLTVAKYYAVGEGLPNSKDHIVGGDQYELALPAIALLIEGGADQPRLPVWGLVCAFVTNDYDLAAKYAQMAQESGALAAQPPDDPAEQQITALAQQYAVAIDAYRAKWAKESAIRAAEAQADDLPRVRFTTTQGDIVIELFENEAPQSVANFLTLVKDGFYDGVAFHRVLPKFMAQGGDPQGTGKGGPGYSIRCECYEPNARMHFRGSLSMAHAGRDTGGSQFFLSFVPNGHLDGRHTVFGRVIEGMDVLGRLQKRNPAEDPQRGLPEPDEILEAEVLRDRGHEYTFEKLPGR